MMTSWKSRQVDVDVNVMASSETKTAQYKGLLVGIVGGIFASMYNLRLYLENH